MEGLKSEQITNLKEHVSTLQKELKQTKVEVQAKNQKLWIQRPQSTKEMQ